MVRVRKMGRNGPLFSDHALHTKETKHFLVTSTHKVVYFFIPFFVGTSVVDLVYGHMHVDSVIALCIVKLVVTIGIMYLAGLLTDKVTLAISDSASPASYGHSALLQHATLINLMYIADVANSFAASMETYTITFIINIGFMYFNDSVPSTEFDLPKLCTSFVVLLLVVCTFVFLNRTIGLLEGNGVRPLDNRESSSITEQLNPAIG